MRARGKRLRKSRWNWVSKGRAIAIQMARAGAHVWVNDLYPDRAEKVCREIEEEQGRATPVIADVCRCL